MMTRCRAAAVLAIALAGGCAASVERGQVLPSTQAHAVVVMPVGKLTRVRWISVLPQRVDAPACAMRLHQRGTLWLRVCAEVDPGPWLTVLQQAQQAMDALLPDWQPSRWEVDVMPGGQTRLLQYVRWGRGDQVPLRMAFVAGDDTEQSQRRAVNTLAHETLHVLEARRRVRPDGGGEYRASLAGSCIELATFGSLAVELWKDPAGTLQAAGLSGAQQASLAGYLQAAATVAHFFDTEGGRMDGLQAHCRLVLDGTVIEQAAGAAS